MRSSIVAGCLGLAIALLTTGSALAADAAKGKETFEANCSVCHNADNATVKAGPGLKGLFRHQALANKKKVTDASVMALIEDGGNSMPSFKSQLTKAEKDNLLAYLKTL